MNKTAILAIFTIFSIQAADISLNDQLFNAIESNLDKTPLIDDLLNQKADPNYNNGAPLKLAILKRDKPLIEHLIIHGADPKYKKKGSQFSSPLEFAKNPKFNIPLEIIFILELSREILKQYECEQKVKPQT
jgi:hypothetical protein